MKTSSLMKYSVITSLLASPALMSAQAAMTQNSSYFSNALFNTLLVIIILLAITIIALGNVLKTIASSKMVEEKFREVKYSKTIRNAGELTVLMMLFSPAMQAQTKVREAVSTIGGLESNTFYFLVSIIALEVLVAGIMVKLIKQMVQSEQDVERRKLAQATVKENKLLSKLSGAVAVEEEEKIVLDHSYDGIRELDNDLPPWWKYGFYLTILVAVIYMVNYHLFKSSPLQVEEYKLSMAKAEKDVAEYMKNSANNVDESTVKLLTDASDINTGKDLYLNNCSACHGRSGEGTVGPNLTDEYWLHSGGVKDIFKTIKYGWPDQGMKSWKDDFSPVQIAQLTSFIKTLAGTNPANGKAKQGELYREEASPTDSAVVKKDTIKAIAIRN